MADISMIKLSPDGNIYNLKDIYLRNILKDFDYSNPTTKNSIARGKDITEYFTDGTLYTRISSGTFEDLFVGDYFTANYNGTDINFRIAGFNTLWGQGPINNQLNTNHVIIIPDGYLTTSPDTDIPSNGGYKSSNMNMTVIGSPVTSGNTETINGNLYNIFSDHLLTYYEWVVTGINSNTKSAGIKTQIGASNFMEWSPVQAILMTELEVFGNQIISSSSFDIGANVNQIPLFELLPQHIRTNLTAYYLRNVASKDYWVTVTWYGTRSYTGAVGTGGVRPRFLIG